LIEVKQIKSEQFTSNVYLLTSSLSEEVFLIDCGVFSPVLDYINSGHRVHGVFLTHYHYDHIYYLKQWMDKFPDLVVYGSEITLTGLGDAKRNLSLYHDDPIELINFNAERLDEASKIELFDGMFITAFVTEGHCEGSLTFQFGDHVFTGDALIPNIPTVTKLKTGSKIMAKASVAKIKSLTSEHSIICPGHLEMISATAVEWESY